jgi:putative ABC transport system permease protein
MLGISVGIFSITVIFTLVNTMKFMVTRNLSALGNTVLYVHHWPWKDNSSDWFKYVNRPQVSYQDFEKLIQRSQYAQAICFEAIRSGSTIKANNRSLEGVTINGITEDYQQINALKYVEGRYFSSIELEAGRPVCIVGYSVAMNLFETTQCIGRDIIFQGRHLIIIGVLEKQGLNLFGNSKDVAVLIPYPMMARMFNINRRGVDKLITAKAPNYEVLPQMEDEIIGLLRQRRGLRPGTEDNFAINKQEMLMESLNNLFQVLNNGGLMISFFSLLVGGFGIANIMFVSVRERTVEIGIQKALGARQAFILWQFLIEAVLLCLGGGLFGIVLLLGLDSIGQLIINQFDWGIEIVTTAGDIITGLIVSVIIGLISGFIPAWTAARLDPVEAMRGK